MLVELGSKFSHNKNIEYYLNNLEELISNNSSIKNYILPKRKGSENLNQSIIRTEQICYSYDKKTNVLKQTPNKDTRKVCLLGTKNIP